MSAYTITHEIPSAQDYCNLRKMTGLTGKAVAAAAVGLPNSLFAVQIYTQPQLNHSSRSSTPSSDDSSLSLPDDLSSTFSEDSLSDDGSSNEEPECIGMARVIGDGGLFFQIVDVAVHPAHQGHGLGFRMMQEIEEWLVANVPESGRVGLVADGKAQSLYEKFAFRETALEGSFVMARHM